MIKIKLNSHINLDEGRIEDMKKKYPGKDDLVDLFSTASGDNKYLDWMMKHHEEADSPEEMVQVINNFHKKLPQIEKKDINTYKDFDDFAWTVKNASEPIRELERTGTVKLYEDDKFSIFRPTNKQASCKLGANTVWCISATKSENFFSEYAEAGGQHFFIKNKSLPKEDPNYLICYTLFPDEEDLEINNAVNDFFSREQIAEMYGQETENKFYNLMKRHFEEADLPSKIEAPENNHDVELIKSLLNDPIDERRIKNRILHMFGMDMMMPGEKDEGDMMINPDYNEKNIRSLLSLNNNVVNKLLYRVIKDYYQIQEYIPKRLVRKILDLRQPNQDFKLSEAALFKFNNDKKIFKMLR